MRSAVRVLAVCLVAAATLHGQPAQNPPAGTPQQTLVSRAQSVIDALAAGRFADVARQFNAAMKAALTEDKLRAAWDSVRMSAGDFVRRNASTTQARGEYTAVSTLCDFERTKVDIVVVFDAAGDVGGLQMRPAQPAVPYTPPAYADAAAFTEREVTVGAGEWALPGTLTMPTGTGPFPALVLVHGSGPNDRDETFGPNKTFKDLALGLGSRGVAVLRYDKRTRVHAAKVAPLKQFTVKEETIDDALAAVMLLRNTPGIDPRRVFLLGHSLGGMVVPRIAAADPAIAGVVAMAGAVRSLDQSILDQMTYLANADGSVSDAEQRTIDDAQKRMEVVAALTKEDATAGRDVSGVPASYWIDLRGYDPPAQMAALQTRILVLQGARDYQVTVDDFDKWKAALANRSNAEFRLYPALNHLFLPGEGKSLPPEYSRPGHVPIEVITDIERWIKTK